VENEVERFPVSRLTREGGSSIEDVSTREFPVTIILNDQELVTILRSPKNLKYLTVGFLSSLGRHITKIPRDMPTPHRWFK